jgi:hypothetical protein
MNHPAHRTETAPPAAGATGRRITLSQVVEQLLAKGSSEHSSVTLSRNSKGETQIEVVVRTGDVGGIETIGEAQAAAATVYDALRELYPYGAEQPEPSA